MRRCCAQLRSKQTTLGRADLCLIRRDRAAQDAAVVESERDFRAATPQEGEIDSITRLEATVDRERGRNGVVLIIRKLLVDRQLVMDAPEEGRSFKEFAVTRRLFDETLHLGPLCGSTRRPPCRANDPRL